MNHLNIIQASKTRKTIADRDISSLDNNDQQTVKLKTLLHLRSYDITTVVHTYKFEFRSTSP